MAQKTKKHSYDLVNFFSQYGTGEEKKKAINFLRT